MQRIKDFSTIFRSETVFIETEKSLSGKWRLIEMLSTKKMKMFCQFSTLRSVAVFFGKQISRARLFRMVRLGDINAGLRCSCNPRRGQLPIHTVNKVLKKIANQIRIIEMNIQGFVDAMKLT